MIITKVCPRSVRVRGWVAGLTLAAVGLFPIALELGAEDAQTQKRPNPITEARGVGLDLYRTLKPKQRQTINAEPLSIETDVTPALKVESLTNGDQHLGCVFATVGFMDLAANIAHAKAIDTVEKGYFEKYVLSLGQESGDKEIRPPARVDEDRFWTEAVMNEFRSNLRQLIGTTVGIKLAHYYLGHYQKYGDKLEDAQGHRTPITNLLSPAEWTEAMRAGLRNALEAGFGLEGTKALYEAIDKMPKRPAWTTYFLPMDVRYKSIKKEMEKLEKDFFAGN